MDTACVPVAGYINIYSRMSSLIPAIGALVPLVTGAPLLVLRSLPLLLLAALLVCLLPTCFYEASYRLVSRHDTEDVVRKHD